MLSEDLIHEYQWEGVDFVIDHDEALMMLKMGLGKTVTSLTAFNILKYDMFEIDSALVIAPKRVAMSVWRQEAAKWEHLSHLRIIRVIGTPKQRMAALKSPADIHVIGRDVVDWLIGVYPGKLPWDMLIIDELSSFKNKNSNRWAALKLVTRYFKRRIGLTGTPAPNSLMDLWAQMYLLDDGERLGKYITHFRKEFFNSTERRRKGTDKTFKQYDIRSESEDLIYNRIDDMTLSMGLEYLDMPERVDIDVEIELPPALMRKYKKFKRDSFIQIKEAAQAQAEARGELFGEITAQTAAVLTNKLLQFSAGAVYDENRKVHPIHNLKMEAAEEWVEAALGEPVILIYNYIHTLDRLMARFKKYGIEKLSDDDCIERWNRGEIPILVFHTKSGGHGLNLQGGGSNMLHVDNTWSAEDKDQTDARLFRQGQDAETVRIGHLVVKGTMDERVRSIQTEKLSGQAALMDALKNELADVVS